MKDYGVVKSAVKPDSLKIDEHSVWISTDIKPVEKEIYGDKFIGFSYHMIQYDKDEFILLQQQTIENQITDTQLALCELYERNEG